MLTALIVVIVIAAVWSLSLKILFGLVLSGSLDPFDYSAFQAVFGMIFTVIIALEFKKSLWWWPNAAKPLSRSVRSF